MISSGGKINMIVPGPFDNSGEMQSEMGIELDVGTLNNSGSIKSPECITIKTHHSLNNIETGIIEGRVVSIEGDVSNAKEATIIGNKSLTLPDRLIQTLVGAESVTADAVITTQADLAARGGTLIGHTLTINPF